MSVNIEKEAWKDEVLESLKGIKRAEPNPFLYTRIESKLFSGVEITPTQLRWATITLVAILAFNAAALLQHRSTSVRNSNEYSLSNFSTY